MSRGEDLGEERVQSEGEMLLLLQIARARSALQGRPLHTSAICWKKHKLVKRDNPYIEGNTSRSDTHGGESRDERPSERSPSRHEWEMQSKQYTSTMLLPKTKFELLRPGFNREILYRPRTTQDLYRWQVNLRS